MNFINTRSFNRTLGAAGFALTALGVFGALSGQPAQAASPDELPALVVEYDVRSLDTDQGARSLYRRLQGAVRQVCPDAPVHDLAGRAAVDRCRQESLARAVRQVDSVRLAFVASIL